jgi:hypothetical protein
VINVGDISRIVNVQISLNTTGISVEGFNTMLIVGAHAHSLARVETYTAASDMIAAGFSDTDPLYLAAVDAFSQTPRPRQVKIGRRLADAVDVQAKKVTSAGTYKVTISTKDTDGNVTSTPYTYTNSGGTASDIALGLKALIDADSSAAVTATQLGDVLTLTGVSGDSFKVEVSSNMSMGVKTVTETIAETMAAIVKGDNDWYGWVLTDRTPATILAAAAWTESVRKLFGTAIAEPGAYDPEVTTDTGYLLYNNNFYRTFWFYHKDAATDYPEAAVMARCFAILPGGETWANKKLAGVTTDPLTETQYIAITKKNGNTFERFRNVSITQNGKVAAGEWIDVIRFRDWLQEEITVNVFNALINSDKIPYTDDGIAIIEAQIRQALELGTRRGGIAPIEYDEDGNENYGYTISVPLSSSISANQKATRVLQDVSFTARLAGAIHVVEITGSLTYENLIVGGATA